jgi:hypothetical protein
MIIFGTRLFGKVDAVPGVFHVATKFFHLNFLPLIPTSSWVVLEGTQEQGLTGSSWRGVELSSIRMSSVLMAWLRFGLFAIALASVVMGLASMDSGRATMVGGLVVGGLAVAGFFFSYQLGRASAESLQKLVNDQRFPVELARIAKARLEELDAGRPPTVG